MDLYSGVILVKRIPGIPRASPEPPGTSDDPGACPLAPQGTPLGPPEDPRDKHGPQTQPYLSKFPAPEALACCIRILSLQCIAPKTALVPFYAVYVEN